MLSIRKIGTQIGIGFGFVLVIMGLVSLFAVKGLQTGSDSFKAYRSLARQSVLSGRVQANMLMASKAAKDFLKTREEAHLEVFDARFRQASDFARQQSNAMQDAERRRLSERLLASLDNYRAVAEKTFELMRNRDTILQKKLNPQGKEKVRDLFFVKI